MRVAITTTFLKLRHGCQYEELSFPQARRAISALALNCYHYNELTTRSRTLQLVRVLDMALNEESLQARELRKDIA